ncbi:MAG: hypothetical protein Fur0010_08960 [Bdellovibrio sp.]
MSMNLVTKFKNERRLLFVYFLVLAGLYHFFNQEFKSFVSEYVGSKSVKEEIAQETNYEQGNNFTDGESQKPKVAVGYKPEILPDLQISRLKGEVFLIDEMGNREKVGQDTKLIKNGSIETLNPKLNQDVKIFAAQENDGRLAELVDKI